MSEITIGKRIREVRKKHGLTQEQFADSLGMNEYTVFLWEKGEFMPRIDTLKEICMMYHVSADWLLGLKEGEDDG